MVSRLIGRLAITAAVTVGVACGDDGVSPKHAQSRLRILPDSVATVKFWPGDTVRLESRRLDASGAPLAFDTARFVWQSSDTSVVAIDPGGVATVVGFGEATITVRVADRTNSSVASTRDTATSAITLAAAPAVIHPGPIRAAFTGAGHQCVVLASGRAHCRGASSWGQIGVGMTGAEIATWTQVHGDLTFSSITGGLQHTCALAIDRSAIDLARSESERRAPSMIHPGTFAGGGSWRRGKGGGLGRWYPRSYASFSGLRRCRSRGRSHTVTPTQLPIAIQPAC